MDISSYLKERGGLVESYLKTYFEVRIESVPDLLQEAMSYSMLAGGKKLRPILAMAAYEACGGEPEDVLECASALEVIHTYSLIHDDLPAMDDDDLRRGRPTSHKVYGEAVAILTGDGLLTEAFLMMLNSGGKFGDSALLDAMRELSLASGSRGMVGGQVQDMLSENQKPDPDMLDYIHAHKTGMLIKCSVTMGAILYGAEREIRESLEQYGKHLGLSFQIVDDVLDEVGDEKLLGKPVGSDTGQNKMTYPALYGIDESRKRAEEHMMLALEAIEGLDERADALRDIARYIIKRQY